MLVDAIYDIRAEYFQWLCDVLGANGNKRDSCPSYYLLLLELHDREFVPIIEMDENRAMDGVAIRQDFFEQNPEYDYDYIDYMDDPCSVLEMIYALARRMEFEVSGTEAAKIGAKGFFWEIIKNLQLDQFTDDDYYDLNGMYEIDEIVTDMIERNYNHDGQGGMFPLLNPHEDQRNIEIWHQMSCYMQENYPV